MKSYACLCAALIIALMSGCGSLSNLSANMVHGAEMGGAAGAIAGGVIGSKGGSTMGGALIGGGIGVVAGALVGGVIDRSHHESTANTPPTVDASYASAGAVCLPSLPYPDCPYSEEIAYQPAPRYKTGYIYQETGTGRQAIACPVYDGQPYPAIPATEPQQHYSPYGY